jgi:hypothetical protein
MQQLLFLPDYRSCIRHLREPLPNPTGHTPVYLRIYNPRDRNLPDAIYKSRDGEAPAYSRI